MLTGRIRNRQVWLTVEILNNSGRHLPVEVVLDTGFEGELALLIPVIRQLGLQEYDYGFAEQSDGSFTRVAIYRATVLWDGQRRRIDVIESGSEPLLGMELLLGSRVVLDVHEGGPVTITALS